MLLTAATFIVILTVLVLIHELGHFVAARIIGVRVEEFGLGLPPKFFGKKIGDTQYTINWLPIGGFVRLAGEDEAPDTKSSKLDSTKVKRLFWARSKKERAVILTAGVVMNFLLAVGITAFLLVNGVQEPSGRVHIVRVAPGTPAHKAGLREGDVISSVGPVNVSDDSKAVSVTTTSDLISYTKNQVGQPVKLVVLRLEETFSVSLVPREEYPKDQGPMGVAISDLETHTYSLAEAPGKAVMINVRRAWDMLASLGATIGRLVTLRPPQAEVAGPIGIASVTGKAVSFGWEAVLEFASILSLNLAVLNILPIPALDGGRLAFVFLEKIFRRRVNPIFERNAHQFGMIVLLALILLVSINDILRLARG